MGKPIHPYPGPERRQQVPLCLLQVGFCLANSEWRRQRVEWTLSLCFCRPEHPEQFRSEQTDHGLVLWSGWSDSRQSKSQRWVQQRQHPELVIAANERPQAKFEEP